MLFFCIATLAILTDLFFLRITIVSSLHRFAALSENSDKKEVFHKEEPGDVIILKDLMKEIMSIKARQDLQDKQIRQPKLAQTFNGTIAYIHKSNFLS